MIAGALQPWGKGRAEAAERAEKEVPFSLGFDPHSEEERAKAERRAAR